MAALIAIGRWNGWMKASGCIYLAGSIYRSISCVVLFVELIGVPKERVMFTVERLAALKGFVVLTGVPKGHVLL
ncbi:MAG: hypothetical protein IIC82_08780 [Chloroflexi bacterium]|nr:hypothetical protein [Chloroflexota bacterium]